MNKLSDAINNLTPEQRVMLEQRLSGNTHNKNGMNKIQPRSDAEKPALSYSQFRLWFLDQYAQGNPAFNMPTAYRFKGALELDILERSINSIVQRHEALRTILVKDEREPYQKVYHSLRIPLSITDLREESEEEKERIALELVKEEMRYHFDLATGPLIRTVLHQLKDDEFILLITIHHIVSDGWSIGIFFRELNTFYRSFLHETKPELPEISIQYADYSIWQRNLMHGEKLQGQLSYWINQLSNPSILDLPTDYPRPEIQSYRGESQHLVLSKELTSSLKLLSKKERATSFMILLTAFKILLHRFTGQTDILIGIPIAGRNRIETENLIGFFLNSLVLRSNLSGNPSFLELFKQVRQCAIDAYDNQDIPFEKIIEEMNPPRDLSRTPLYQVYFNMVNVRSEVPDLENVIVEPYSTRNKLSKFDLTVYIHERHGRFQFSFTYNSGLFSHKRISELKSQFQYLLEQVSTKSDLPINAYKLNHTKFKNNIPDPTIDLSNKWFGPIHEKVTEHATKNPEKVAISDMNGEWTYRDLEIESEIIARNLIQAGVKSQDIIGIYAYRSTELVAAILGIHKAGCAFLILDPAHPNKRILTYLQLAKPKGLIHVKAAGDLPDEIKNEFQLSETIHIPILTIDRQSKVSDPTERIVTARSIKTRPDDLAYIAFTSGSSGQPKGIRGRHGSLSHFIPWQQEEFDIGSTDRFSMLSGLSHDPLHRDIFTCLWAGATLCIPDPEKFGEPGWLIEWIKREKISFVHLTPAMGQFLCFSANTTIAIDTVRYFFFVGDNLTQTEVKNLRNFAPNATYINSYGSTETQRAIGYFPVTPELQVDPKNQHRTYPIGNGFPDVQLLVLNEEGNICGVGELGEIHVRSPHLALGYFGDDELTDSQFIGNPFTNDPEDKCYKTGDLGRYLPDGNVQFAGRKDKQVKIRGFRIELEEIESALINHDKISDAFVITREDDAGNKNIIAYFIFVDGKEEDAFDIRNYLLMSLPDYMVPSTFISVEHFPLTPNGKINVDKLINTDHSPLQQTDKYVRPRTEEEKIITQIWSEILGVEKIGIYDNFYDLGGHSLVAIQIVANLSKAIGKTIPIAALIKSPSVEGLGKTIGNLESYGIWNTLSPLKTTGNRYPLFCIPPAASTAIRFKLLSDYLGVDQPIYGLEYPGMDGSIQPLSSIPEIAKIFLSDIKEIQPDGPYYLAGMCYGGNVAFEIAQQLFLEGSQVAFLGIIDSNLAPGTRRPIPYYMYLIKRYIYNGILRMDKYDGELMPKRVRRHLDNKDPIRRHITKVHTASFLGRIKYKTKRYPGRITRFSTDSHVARYATKNWEKITSVGLENHLIPGNHFRGSTDETSLMEEPHIQVLAKILEKCLDKTYDNSYFGEI